MRAWVAWRGKGIPFVLMGFLGRVEAVVALDIMMGGLCYVVGTCRKLVMSGWVGCLFWMRMCKYRLGLFGTDA